MRRILLAAWAGTVLGLAVPAPAGHIDVDLLRRKQETQQRARDLARELVTSILDIQLQQLEENGLDSLPLYRDIRQMRTNIDGLVEAEMADVVSLLLKAQEASSDDRDALFVQARQKVREVVVRLSIERQNLLRRLKTAELAAQVKRVIERQSVVYDVTRSLSEQPMQRREALLLETIQDQRDVKALYLRLVDMLQEVRGWGGDVGNGAAEGLNILKAAQVADELDAASQRLDAADTPLAARRQAAALKGLRLLLEKIEETQGLVGADREVALETVRELIKQQEKLRDDTRAAELSDAAVDPLVQRETAIQKELATLPELLRETPAALPLVEQAKTAAYDAAGKLFDAEKDAALAEQAKVLARLTAIEQELLAAAESEHSDKTAEQLAQLVDSLEQTHTEVQTANNEAGQLHTIADENPSAAKQQAEQAARRLASAGEGRKLPKVVEARLKEAAEAARQAGEKLAQADDLPDTAQTAVAAAESALERLQTEVEAALADAKRQKLAVEIGELARAAETLERAAAAEKRVAQRAANAAAEKSPDAKDMRQLAAEAAEIDEIVRRVGEGVKNTAPKAAETLAKAADQTQAAAAALAAAENQPERADRTRQGSQAARQASERLARAASQLRQQIGQAAGELSHESQRQLAQVSPAREAVEQAAAARPAPLAQPMERLSQAEQKTREAMHQQLRAAGKPAAAAAQELAQRVERAAVSQAAAQQAADDVARGKAESALDAALRQQAAAEEAGQVAAAAAERPHAAAARKASQPDSLGEALQKAQQAAARAAKETLDGNHRAAGASRREAAQMLAAAQTLAEAEAQRAAEMSSGEPDMAAQAKVTAAAAEAGELAGDDAPPARAALAVAQRRSSDAQRHAEDQNAAARTDAQEASAKALDEALRQLQAAQVALAARHARQMAQQADEAGDLAGRAARVDPAALAAMRSAEKSARQASDPPAATPRQAAAAQQDVNQSLERAAANLAAREEKIRRDESLAEAILAAAQQQQSASEQIAAQSEALEQEISPPAAQGQARPTPQQMQQAAGLAQAMRDFARAQQIAGQAAEEVSGQAEVMNAPLREALKAASELPAPATGEPVPPDERQPHEAAAAMGTQFQPRSPEVTAQMMAGPQALAKMAQIQQPGPPSAAPPTAAGPSQQPSPQHLAANSNSPSEPNSSPSLGGDEVKAGPSPAGSPDTRQAARTFREEPWVARLPPELRQAIRAQSQRPPPRGYEERLKRYFENVD